MAKTTKDIALVCPGGQITPDLAEKMGKITADHVGDAVRLHFHAQCFLVNGHFAGTDEERSAAFLEIANDPAYDALWLARGGYGAIRLDDGLFTKLNDSARAKTYLGYSDHGVLLARLYGMGFENIAHGPIATDLNREGGESAIRRALDFLSRGNTDGVEPTAKTGKPVVAFNITVLANLIGLDWTPDFSGHIVMLEDVGEYLYRIDRSLSAIIMSPRMQNAAGIKLGRISAVPENDRPFGSSEEEIAQYWCKRAGIAYLGRADIGHDGDNKIVPFGRTVSA